ncbi:MAG: CDGSH iron-sulfur domain-containing protein [Candidatus Krumholzibacteria bacterium]|jgi:CDGSH-type Zn-finger protein|nr:CDGSH iron-sulfur domain-containing protein [Candidatus Krumholzibacteria bacterium]
MQEPKIADKKPAVLELAAGTYWYCACGQSANQPFCDGSHKGTPFRPLQVDLAEPGKIAFCQCKRSGRQPRCDGTHRNL